MTPPPKKKILLSDCVFFVKIGAVKSHTLTGGRGGAKINFYPYLPRVFFGMDPYVMLLGVRELLENRRREC
jgi:hypothetical protein